MSDTSERQLTVDDLPQIDRPTQFSWITLPEKLGHRGQGPLTIGADGHYLVSLGPLAGVLPWIALVAGFVMGWRTIGFDAAITESLGLVSGLLVLGVISTNLSSHWLVGFAVGNFFLGGTVWWLEPPARWLDEFIPGFFEYPPVAAFAFERVPLLIHYLLIGLLIVGVPTAARMMIASFARRLVGTERARMFIIGTLAAVALLVLARFWSVAAPHVIRPLFTWDPAWIGDRQPPDSAVVPIQNNATFARIGAAAMLGRFLFVWWASNRVNMRLRMAAVEIELAERLTVNPPSDPSTSLLAMLGRAAVGGLVSLMLIAGLLQTWAAAGLMFAAFMFARFLRIGVLPFPSRGWREAMDQIPVALRFAGTMLLIHGVASAMLGAAVRDGTDTLQTLVWPMAIGMVLIAIIMPNSLAASRPDDGDSDSERERERERERDSGTEP